jgi:hypothetical protein
MLSVAFFNCYAWLLGGMFHFHGFAECHCAECCICIVILSILMLSIAFLKCYAKCCIS